MEQQSHTHHWVFLGLRNWNRSSPFLDWRNTLPHGTQYQQSQIRSLYAPLRPMIVSTFSNSISKALWVYGNASRISFPYQSDWTFSSPTQVLWHRPKENSRRFRNLVWREPPLAFSLNQSPHSHIAGVIVGWVPLTCHHPLINCPSRQRGKVLQHKSRRRIQLLGLLCPEQDGLYMTC